jgi:hypothetical protein
MAIVSRRDYYRFALRQGLIRKGPTAVFRGKSTVIANKKSRFDVCNTSERLFSHVWVSVSWGIRRFPMRSPSV